MREEMNDLLSSETEWRGTDVVNVSVDVKGKGEKILCNKKPVKHQQNRSCYLLYALFKAMYKLQNEINIWVLILERFQSGFYLMS